MHALVRLMTEDLKVTPDRALIRGGKPLRLAVDTGSSDTVVVPEIIDDLGYCPRFVAPDYRIHVFDLATGDDINGLIGLSFLTRFNCEFRFAEVGSG